MIQQIINFLMIFIIFLISSCDFQQENGQINDKEQDSVLKKITLSTHGSDADI